MLQLNASSTHEFKPEHSITDSLKGLGRGLTGKARWYAVRLKPDLQKQIPDQLLLWN
jgi:hypothetical protein